MFSERRNNMDVLLFEYLPPFTLLILAGAIAYYMFKLLYPITEEAKGARTITEVVLCIIAVLILSISLILMVALAIEVIV